MIERPRYDIVHISYTNNAFDSFIETIRYHVFFCEKCDRIEVLSKLSVCFHILFILPTHDSLWWGWICSAGRSINKNKKLS